MNAFSIAMSVLGGLGVLAGIYFAVKSSGRTTKKDEEDAGQNKGVMLTEIGYIKSGVDDIKRKQDQLDSKQTAYLERLVCVEQSTKQAHHRIDEIVKT